VITLKIHTKESEDYALSFDVKQWECFSTITGIKSRTHFLEHKEDVVILDHSKLKYWAGKELRFLARYIQDVESGKRVAPFFHMSEMTWDLFADFANEAKLDSDKEKETKDKDDS
jgi:hypothetical protein